MSDIPASGKAKAPRRKTVAPIASDAFENPQLSLFQGFLANTDDEREALSNAVALWDNIPRYSVSRARMNELRTPEGFLPVMELPFQYRGKELTAIIYPAQVKGKDGTRTSYYPSAREEIVEHALRKLSAEQQAGFFDKLNARSGVQFSLYALRQELEQQGHTLRYDQLIEALDILSLSSIEIVATNEDGDEGFARSTYFAALSGVKRKDYNADRSARWAAQFHPLVTKSIDKLTYRQFNYQRLMKCRSQLTRWLLSQLGLKFTQASLVTPFEVHYITVKRDSGLLDGYKLARQAVAALDDSFNELKELGALNAFNKSEQRGARSKLEDVIYTLFPSRDFIAEQKAANHRQAKGGLLLEPTDKASNSGQGK
jgi:hypothetical protein